MNIIFLILSTLFVVIILKITPILYNAYVMRRKVKDIPTFGGFPFIDTALKLLRMTDSERTAWYLSFIPEAKEGIWQHIYPWMGIDTITHIFKPEFLEIIFPSTENIEKAYVYDVLRPWLGQGLLTSTGPRWFHDRRLIGPTFHFSILEQFAIIQSEKAEILTKCLEKEIEKDPGRAIDICPFITNVTLDIICETAMGVNLHAQEVETEYAKTVHKTTLLLLDRVIRPWYSPDWIYDRTSMGKETKSLLNKLHGFTKKVIIQRKEERKFANGKTKSEDENDESIIGRRKVKAFLDALLDENEKTDTPLTDDELRAQVDTFMFEGQDTTAVALIWALFLLGNNLDHQEKVHEELDRVFEKSEAPATIKELSQLKYLERVIKETLRLYPSVSFFGRKVAKDIKLGRYTVPKGSTVILPPLLVHRNPEVWPNPEKFDPDRFLPENSEHRNPYAYVPFSAGPRNCIGQRFALNEEKFVLSAILRKWRLKSVKSVNEMPFSIAAITRPCEPVFIHFTAKKHANEIQ